MQQNAILTIQGKQYYGEGKPEVIELITEGVLEQRPEGGWYIAYEESPLTGLEGVTTVFEIFPQRVVLSRSGALQSRMVFQLGVPHASLYQMEFGALMITVCAQKVSYDLSDRGGTVDLCYSIDIENSAGGTVEYHLDVQTK